MTITHHSFFPININIAYMGLLWLRQNSLSTGLSLSHIPVEEISHVFSYSLTYKNQDNTKPSAEHSQFKLLRKQHNHVAPGDSANSAAFTGTNRSR